MRVLQTVHTAQFSTDLADKPIVASGQVVDLQSYRYPVNPPRDWFAKKAYDGPLPKRVLPDGQVYGHVCGWDQLHTAYDGRRVYPPRSRSQNAHFMVGHVTCDDVSQVRSGPIWIECDHADLDLNEHQAKEFMAHTGSAVADVACYEDQWGIQIAGAVRPDATPAQVRAFEGSDVSPDWRPQPGGGHELIGMVVVNRSGFITPAMVASGSARKVADGRARVRWDEQNDRPLAMVAVGMICQETEDPLEQIRREFASQLQVEFADVRAFMADRRADELMERFSGSKMSTDMNDMADGFAARAAKILDTE